jgi:hypothetical protein
VTLADLTPEKIAQFETQRKAKLSEQKKQDAELQAEKKRAEAYWKNKQNSLPLGNPKTEQKCSCGATIPAHTPSKYSVKKTVYGSNVGFKRVYHCQTCRPITEVS